MCPLSKTIIAEQIIMLIDINECRDQMLNKCSDGAECSNTNGSYECICPVGSKLENDARTCRGIRLRQR